MKNLMIDLTPLYGRKITGLEIYGIEFYQALLKSRYKIIPVFRKENTIDDNPNAIVIPYDNRFLVENILLPRIIKKLKPDYVFFPIFPPPLHSYHRGVKIVPTIHDIAFRHFAKTLSLAARIYLTPKYNKALKKSDKIITISNTVSRELSEISKIPIINCNNNISKDYQLTELDFNLKYIQKFGLMPDEYLISVSTIEPRKNMKYLLEIWKRVQLANPNLKLVLTGRSGWEKDAYLNKILLENKNSIVFTDYVSFTELYNLYHYSKAFILLSVYEGFGRPPLEALACGTNIIVSDIPIFRETLSSYKVTFIPLDNENMAVDLFKQALTKPKIVQDVNKYFNLLEESLIDYLNLIIS